VADNPLVQRAERWNDIVLLSKSKANIDGEQADTWTPPVGIGDLAVMEMLYVVTAIDVLATLGSDLGCTAYVINAAGDTFVDIIGSVRFVKDGTGANALSVCAYFSPDPLVLVKQGERIYVTHGEVDTDATPTGDAALYVKAVRVNAQVSPKVGPIQLVR